MAIIISNVINRISNPTEEFHGFIGILSIEDVSRKDGESKTQFTITARDGHHGDKRREYIFKCESETMRNKWVDGITKYVKYFHGMQHLLDE